MAKPAKTASLLANFRGANKEARTRYLAEAATRERAANILNPTEVSGEYDAGRMLSTTLGGVLRPLTIDDLNAFRQNVKTVGKKYRGGITAKSVIDLSLPDDRERANRQIRTAVPAQYAGGRLHFITNAGPDSDVTRHHVHIELLNYGAAVSSPSKVADMARFMATGPLTFDCDCGRHRYWYRYIATVGKYNAGRPEVGYPKIRNPQLVGVACKHVLRVMQQLGTPQVRALLETMITKAREKAQAPSKVLTKAEAQKIAEEQARQANWQRTRVESSSERNTRLAAQRAAKAAATKALERSKTIRTPAARAAESRRMIAHAQVLATAGLITQKQLQAIVAKAKSNT